MLSEPQELRLAAGPLERPAATASRRRIGRRPAASAAAETRPDTSREAWRARCCGSTWPFGSARRRRSFRRPPRKSISPAARPGRRRAPSNPGSNATMQSYWYSSSAVLGNSSRISFASCEMPGWAVCSSTSTVIVLVAKQLVAQDTGSRASARWRTAARASCGRRRRLRPRAGCRAGCRRRPAA